MLSQTEFNMPQSTETRETTLTPAERCRINAEKLTSSYVALLQDAIGRVESIGPAPPETQHAKKLNGEIQRHQKNLEALRQEVRDQCNPQVGDSVWGGLAVEDGGVTVDYLLFGCIVARENHGNVCVRFDQLDCRTTSTDASDAAAAKNLNVYLNFTIAEMGHDFGDEWSVYL